MIRAKNIFLHFFDVHYLNEKGLTEWRGAIFREASLATKIALLGSDNIVIPASSYFESPLCRRIVDSYAEIQHLGFFKLVGNASNVDEFIQFKTGQYKFNTNTSEIYESYNTSDIAMPFSKRHRSSTTDISKQWQDLQIIRDIKPIFINIPDISIPKNIEYLWNEVPFNLNGKPFIVDNVFPILFPQQNKSIIATNILHSHINQYYFSSYTNEYGAGIISDLVYLEPDYNISTYDTCLPYKYIMTELAIRNKSAQFISASPEDILKLRESDEWIDIMTKAFNKKEMSNHQLQCMSKHKHFTNSGQSSISGNITQFNIKGDFHVGDFYKAGQVGSQGPNSHAHDITFNQIWNNNKNEIDLNELADQLANLRLELTKKASSPEEYAEIGIVANAEIEAKNGKGAKAMEFLSQVGKWTFNTATALGVAVAANAIKIAAG